MNISCVLILFAVFMLQADFVLADKLGSLEGSGKPGNKTKRYLGGWSSTSKSHKSSKSTDSPTLFPTVSPSLFPTMSPTYCGKASKSSWHSSSRRLNDWSSTSKSAKCFTGSRSSKSWWSGHSRRTRVNSGIGKKVQDTYGGRKEQDLEQKDKAVPDHNEVQVRRRRIDGDMHANLDKTEP